LSEQLLRTAYLFQTKVKGQAMYECWFLRSKRKHEGMPQAVATAIISYDLAHDFLIDLHGWRSAARAWSGSGRNAHG
jgi:hypothetical protein